MILATTGLFFLTSDQTICALVCVCLFFLLSFPQTANRLQADFIVFIGTDEINENVATIKDLKTGQQLQVSSDCIFDKIFKITAEVS